MKNIFKIIVFAIPTAFFFSSCGTSASDKTITNGTDSSIVKSDSGKVNELTEFKYDMVISNIPIPFDILSSLTKSGVNFNKSILNTPSNVSKYSQNNSKAVNLGIFGADLAYTISFEQFSEVGQYLKSTKTLADALGIPIAFDQKALTNYDKYQDNKDSLSKIIFNSYNEVDKTLKSNERIGLASLVVTGGWIEGLYTTTKTLGTAERNEKTNALYKKIFEQRTHLVKLIGLLGEFSNSDKFFADLINDLNGLKAIYDGLVTKADLSTEDVATIRTKIDEIRTKLAKG